MNRKEIFLALGLVATLSVSLGFSLSSTKETPQLNSNKQGEDTNPCDNISEAVCFGKLSGCMKANSTSDFLKNKNFHVAENDWPENWTSKVSPPIQTNFPSAEIFLNLQPSGGGDRASYPFIKLGNNYCDLNDDNLKIIFAPIKNREDALKYYLFLRKDMGSASSQSQSYILKQGDYEDANIKRVTENCNKNYKEKLKNRVTETSTVEDGYLIRFVGLAVIQQIEFYELQVVIKFNGAIETMPKKTLLNCGPGIVF